MQQWSPTREDTLSLDRGDVSAFKAPDVQSVSTAQSMGDWIFEESVGARNDGG
jgi:hypothetical protein